MKLDEVLAEMRTHGFTDDQLTHLTQQVIDDTLKDKQSPSFGPPGASTFQGNSFFIGPGNCWHWRDAPGSQCGQTRGYGWRPGTGSSYVKSGNCPQGYPWYTIVIWGGGGC
jgi:hypothetical protein